MKQTFRKFLEAKHAKVYQGLDDDMPDAFDEWLSGVSSDAMFTYAQEWEREQTAVIEMSPDEIQRAQQRISKHFVELTKVHKIDATNKQVLYQLFDFFVAGMNYTAQHHEVITDIKN